MGTDASVLVDEICRLAEVGRREGAQAAGVAGRDAADEDLRAAMALAAAGVTPDEIMRRLEARVFGLTLIGEGMAGIMSGEDPAALRARLGAMLGEQGRARLTWRDERPAAPRSAAA